MTVKFTHLQHEKDVYNHQGAQYPFIGFDEITHFSWMKFQYMMSRNRSTSGVPGYIRGTCNPDPDSWVREWVDWWIDEEGYPIKKRSGILRYFFRRNDQTFWGDSKEELCEKYGNKSDTLQQQMNDLMPKSFTFIPATIYDNKILLEKDPSYLANLKALNKVDRMRLLGGNWDIRPSAGLYFQEEWFEVVDAYPAKMEVICRYWDRAATKETGTNDPDYTVGIKLGKTAQGEYYVLDMKRFRDTPLQVENKIKNVASNDGLEVEIGIEQDPGSAGKSESASYVRLLAGYVIRLYRPTKDKLTRAKPVSAQCEHGNVKVVRGDWNNAFFRELENFDGSGNGHDDIVDSFSGAFNAICNTVDIDIL
jgi:predicted phage terminase large subunit-like protein